MNGSMRLPLSLSFFFFKQKTAYEMLRSLVGSEMCIRDSIVGFKLRRRNKTEGMVEDLYNLISPVAASTRGQCGLIETKEALAFEATDKARRQSHDKTSIDVISIQQEPGRPVSQGKRILRREPEIFNRFVANVGSMLEQRGLAFSMVQTLQRDLLSNFWLSDISLGSILDSQLSSEILEKQWRNTSTLTDVMTWLGRDERVTKWLKKVNELIARGSNCEELSPPPKRFENRGNWTRQTSLCGQLRFSINTTTLQCIAQKIHGVNSLVLENALGPVTQKEERSLPDYWPFKEFRFSKNDLQNDLEGIIVKVPEMTIPNTRIKIVGSWHPEPYRMNDGLIKMVDYLKHVTSLTYLDINLGGCSTLDDEGCAAIAAILRSCTKISSFHIQMHRTKITDVGISHITNELSFLPLRNLLWNLRYTQLSDRSIISLSDSVRRMTPQLNSFVLSIEETIISDEGVTALITALSFHRSLSKLTLNPVSYTHLTLPTIYSV
eukprot:TRINITY_DN10627_c0_g1_i1.p1 TRINITY_DN10627_c0_g1~~TRINITY_DN10627_c0_g1_i1.p1  ORF type:complete len:493 (-),score=35.98 TRINITY_DN10627_c0_g1_i1:33-1511(-)